MFDYGFQSTHPYRVWRRESNLTSFTNKFQSTHPYRVWHTSLTFKVIKSSFNPHTHTGCDLKGYWTYQTEKVSIHTPIQGVTLYFFLECCYFAVSIHTPIQGVTCSVSLLWGASWVSIHTPIQGVTYRGCLLLLLIGLFQSTHPYRVWQTPCSIFASIRQFQSTHPYRVWLMCLPAVIQPLCFNPHTHTGCDFIRLTLFVYDTVSIHTPIQGVTQVWYYQVEGDEVSIHTPIQGVTAHGSCSKDK